MPYLLASLVLLIASWASSISAESYSYLFADVALVHGLLSGLCVALFLLAIVVAVLANTDSKGRIGYPQSLSSLACLLLLVPTGGFAVGRVIHYASSLEIMNALQSSPGVSVYSDGEFVVLDGEIGHQTLSSMADAIGNKQAPAVILKSGGGLLDVGLEIGRLIDQVGADIIVVEFCESACVIAALSGRRLFVTPEARFGFHQASAIASETTQLGEFIGNRGTDIYITALANLGVPESILLRARGTAADEMYYLSGHDMVELGLALDLSHYWN